MPGYLTVPDIDQAVQYIANKHPSLTQLIVLPEQSLQKRTIYALRIGGGTARDRDGVLFIGGVHARELVNPDCLLSWSLKLCDAYAAGTGLSFGPKTYNAAEVKLIVELLYVYVLPCVNPDGRVWVQQTDPMWRKNRRWNIGSSCKGVDINRNYDFVWSETIGMTSSSACSDVFKGKNAFSEPETRNVRWMLDTYANIECMIDVHSYSELVLYPWGDDDTQTTDPTMNFMNPAYNGQRGIPGSPYREYMPAADLTRFTDTGAKLRDAIAAVRNRVYTLKASVLLYPTSGTAVDYAYSRHFVNASQRCVYSYTLETAREFQPAPAEAQNVMTEVCSGLTTFCLKCLCPVRVTFQRHARDELEGLLELFRDRVLVSSVAGAYYVGLLDRFALEATLLLAGDERLAEETRTVVERVGEVVGTWEDPSPKRFEPELIDEIEALLARFAERGSGELKAAVDEVRRDLEYFRGRTVLEGLEAASAARRTGPKQA